MPLPSDFDRPRHRVGFFIVNVIVLVIVIVNVIVIDSGDDTSE